MLAVSTAFYRGFERALTALHPLFKRIGYQRLERPVAVLEHSVKGLLFDCRMCGQCILSSTGMSCPMNCPKNLRNGPCGGVRANGNCEVRPDMKCVWNLAVAGSARIPGGAEALSHVQLAGRPPSARENPPGCAWRASAPETALDLRGRAGTRVSAADPAGSHLPRPSGARAARRAVRGDDGNGAA